MIYRKQQSPTSSNNYNCLTMTLFKSICYFPLLILILQGQFVTNTLNANFSGPGQTAQMIINNIAQPYFTLVSPLLDCSLSNIFTYWQSDQDLLLNTPTSIIISTTQTATISLSTKYGLLQPSLSNTSCPSPGCTISITNNCRQPIHFQNYFDIFQVGIVSGNTQYNLSYFVYCKESFSQNTLEWGIIVEILLLTVMIAIVALYSKPWSLGGRAIEINYWLIGTFVILLVLGSIIAIFSSKGIQVCLYILSFVLGILGVGICTNQVLFLLRMKKIGRVLFRIDNFQFKLMQALSLLVGLIFTLWWYFSDNNIILNNILSICICVGLIKILKFTNLKMAGLAFIVTVTFELIVVVVIYIQEGVSYNNLFLNNYNFPVEMQFPTLNPVYNQKCSWLPITAIVFPGMLLSYLRRFDSSRNTTVYLVTATVLFLLGGIAWVFANLPSNVTFPFGLISQPCMFGLVCVFAYQRREIRVIWSGEFYDEEFANQSELRVIMEMIDRPQERGESDSERRSTIDRKLIEQLKADSGNASRISDQSVIRSKFLKT